MKNLLKYSVIAMSAAALTLSSCDGDKLNTAPTDKMSGTTLMATGTAALVPLNGIYRSMYTAGWSTTGNTHQCFGISAYNLMADVMGDDMIMGDMGSGWFFFDAAYNVKSRFNQSSWRSYDLWNAYYTWISNANYILAAEETMQDKNYAIGQAYAIRAYSYFMLAQSFARTYKGHEKEPCVPLMTEPTFPGTTGKARATVEEVYKQITADIKKAVEYLNGTTQQASSHISYAVALGLQSRIALVMEDWQTALTAAEEAIAKSGKQILTIDQFKGLNNSEKENVMWAAKVIADQSGMYASLFTHMGDEYYGKSAPKQISKTLYNKMSANDARKAWWDPTSELSTGGYWQNKFYFSDKKTWLGDYVWMRIEEMYLNAAEAACRLGDEAKAKKYLGDLMTKRVPNYETMKTGTALGALTNEFTNSLLEEILIQRRIELWGEFGRVYDIRRLKQGFVRSAADGWPSNLQLSNRPLNNPENYMWVLTIPQKEFDGNANMDPEKDQNPTSDLAK